MKFLKLREAGCAVFSFNHDSLRKFKGQKGMMLDAEYYI